MMPRLSIIVPSEPPSGETARSVSERGGPPHYGFEVSFGFCLALWAEPPHLTGRAQTPASAS